MIEKLKKILEHHEGRVNHVYQDSEGYWTIGIGHLIDERKGGHLSDRIIDLILEEDIDEKLEDCHRFPWFEGLSENRKIVVISMVFNLGIAGFAAFKKTIGYISKGEFENASVEMLKSKWASQVGKRAIELSNMMRDG